MDIIGGFFRVLNHVLTYVFDLTMFAAPIVLLMILYRGGARRAGHGKVGPVVLLGIIVGFLLVYGDPKAFHALPHGALGDANDPDRMAVDQLSSAEFWARGYLDFFSSRMNLIHYPFLRSLETILGVPRFNAAVVFALILCFAIWNFKRVTPRVASRSAAVQIGVTSAGMAFYCIELADWIVLSVLALTMLAIAIPLAMGAAAGVGKGVEDFSKAVLLGSLFGGTSDDDG